MGAPCGLLTPKMVALMQQHKGAPVDLLFALREREAIEWEGQPSCGLTLPDLIFYPADLPDDIRAFRACLDSRRVRPAA